MADPADVASPLLPHIRTGRGYADTNYGRRSPAEVLADISLYKDWYGVASVFFDRSAAGAEHVSHYASLTYAARQMGTVLVAYTTAGIRSRQPTRPICSARSRERGGPTSR